MKPRGNNQLLEIKTKIKKEINWNPKFIESKLIKKLCEDHENKEINQQTTLCN